MRLSQSNGGLVYSTEHGRMCPQCSQPQAECVCTALPSMLSGDGIVRLRCETKGRKGKGVTVISGVPLMGEPLVQLAKMLRQRCSSGGTLKGGVIEIQGDHVAQLLPLLQQQGWVVKKSGG